MFAKSIVFPTVLLSAFSLQATCCRPCCSFEKAQELRLCQLSPAYNATARTDVRCSWDLYATGSYIFWQPREDNLELGIRNRNSDATLAINGRVIEMDYHYKSGFQAGLGVFSDRDNWDVYAEYTWLSGHQRTRAAAPTGGVILPFWGHPDNASSTINTAKGKWGFEFNILDTQLARSYYVGTQFTLRPFCGARAAWINQKYSAQYQPSDTTLPYHVRNSSHSWGAGPEIGVLAHWLLGYGVRLIGTAEADILYTRYNLHMTEESSINPSTLVVNLYQRHDGTLRPHSYLDLGFGWGSYFCNHNYHFDISATYNFQVFWNQNMFRNFVDDVAHGKSTLPNGDLYMHGATGELRFDF